VTTPNPLPTDDATSDKPTRSAWTTLILLALANVLNYFDRVIPAILNEAIRHEWDLNDLQIGMLVSAVTLVYGIASVPFGRLADTGMRRRIMGCGMLFWSMITSLNGFAWSFASYLSCRLGVGIGEASLTPAAMSLIGDLFASTRRGLATGTFMLGMPLGLMLAFLTIGSIVDAFGTWRAAYMIAGVPGIVLAILLFFIREPARGAIDHAPVTQSDLVQTFRTLLRKRTLWWLIASGITFNVAVFPINAFLVPLLQRYFHLSLVLASQDTGIIVGVTGLIGLTLGGKVADDMHLNWPAGRLVFGALALFVSGLLLAAALRVPETGATLFVAIFSLGWLLSYFFYTCAYPTLLDVVAPGMRATAMAVFTALLFLLGGAFGPIVLGLLSDHLAVRAMQAAGAAQLDERFRAIGLHDAMLLAPSMFIATALLMLGAAGDYRADRETASHE
jgi:predicted MFS family arabinose efflux permease